ncbi:MAG: phospho-N-acetylmuramoyl-pentapeptide-transferase, partial [Deltaproteobacteria bacterium]|nr:phospho-N-acetylmuramoyl-pentapeptide-transferase [Deltaproteobacteria bacterium]
MLYHLLYPLHTSFIGFNVFRYITFRSICAAVTAFLIMIVIGPWFIRTMQKMQIGQVVRDDGPASHMAKQGVPTMGGLLILTAILLSTLFWARLDNALVWLAVFVTVFFG